MQYNLTVVYRSNLMFEQHRHRIYIMNSCLLLYVPNNLYLNCIIFIKGIVIRTIHNIYVCMHINSVDIYYLCMIKVRIRWCLVVCYNLG